MAMQIALAGNPNSGKTTLFNALTGANQTVGNWPGVTVEKKTGKLKGHSDVTIVDLPGIYSLSPYTLEEVVARNFIIEEEPSAIINIVDGSNLERNLYLTTQLLELGLPVVLAVNMMDVVNKNGDAINTEALSQKIGCPVIGISALKGNGIEELTNAALQAASSSTVPQPISYSSTVESALSDIEAAIPAGTIDDHEKRFFALKLFERDNKIAEKLGSTVNVENVIAQAEAALDDDAESMIVNERYDFISGIIDQCMTKAKAEGDTISDKIDKVVTNRWLALPIFAIIMFLVYYISVTTVGTIATDWANDGVFGDGWYLGAGQEQLDEALEPYEEAQSTIEAFEGAMADAGIEVGEDVEVDPASYANLTATYDAYDDETGENEVVEVDAAAYEEALKVEEPDPTQYGLWIPGIPVLIGNAMEAGQVNEQVQSLVLDGIVAGVGAVLGFVPQLLVLFFLLAFLEGCGYMSRVAFILDRIFRRFGLSGKTFIPMLIGTGCGIPAVMATRTIENESDRRMTAMTTTFMPCSAKLPIIALFAGAIFGGVWWVAPSAYFLGVAAILLSGIALKKTKPFAGKAAPFVMELPAYHMPTLGSILRSMWERAWNFIKKAFTIILGATILIWFLSTYGFENGSFGVVEDQSASLLAAVGNSFAWIFTPQGFNNWQAASATITGLIAKENVVGTLGVLYAGGAGWYANIQAAYTPLLAYSFLAFNLLCAPCFAAMGAIRKEMNGGKWFWAAIGYECALAYFVSMWIYQIGGLITGEVGFNIWTVVAFVSLAGALYMIQRKPVEDDSAEINLAIHASEAA